MYITAIGLTAGVGEWWKKFMLFTVLVVIFLSGFGYFGLKLTFNVSWLLYSIFETNTVNGIRFLTYNFVIFTGIYFVTFLTEGDIK